MQTMLKQYLTNLGYSEAEAEGMISNTCDESTIRIEDVEYQICSGAIPLLYSKDDVDNKNYKLRSGFRSIRNCSHISSPKKHLVVAMSPQLGKGVVCHHNGNFFITKQNDTEDGLIIEDVTDLIIAVADLI